LFEKEVYEVDEDQINRYETEVE